MTSDSNSLFSPPDGYIVVNGLFFRPAAAPTKRCLWVEVIAPKMAPVGLGLWLSTPTGPVRLATGWRYKPEFRDRETDQPRGRHGATCELPGPHHPNLMLGHGMSRAWQGKVCFTPKGEVVWVLGLRTFSQDWDEAHLDTFWSRPDHDDALNECWSRAEAKAKQAKAESERQAREAQRLDGIKSKLLASGNRTLVLLRADDAFRARHREIILRDPHLKARFGEVYK